eukprot:513877_1
MTLDPDDAKAFEDTQLNWTQLDDELLEDETSAKAITADEQVVMTAEDLNICAEDYKMMIRIKKAAEGAKFIKEVDEWMKQQPMSKLPLIHFNAKVFSTEVIEGLEKEADRYYKTQISRTPKAYLLKRVPISQVYCADPEIPWSPTGRDTFKLGDRVSVLRSDGGIPFGSQGTVIGIHDKFLEILTDHNVMKGSTLHNRCSDHRGVLLPFDSVINLTLEPKKEAQPKKKEETAQNGEVQNLTKRQKQRKKKKKKKKQKQNQNNQNQNQTKLKDQMLINQNMNLNLIMNQNLLAANNMNINKHLHVLSPALQQPYINNIKSPAPTNTPSLQIPNMQNFNAFQIQNNMNHLTNNLNQLMTPTLNGINGINGMPLPNLTPNLSNVTPNLSGTLSNVTPSFSPLPNLPNTVIPNIPSIPSYGTPKLQPNNQNIQQQQLQFLQQQQQQQQQRMMALQQQQRLLQQSQFVQPQQFKPQQFNPQQLQQQQQRLQQQMNQNQFNPQQFNAAAPQMPNMFSPQVRAAYNQNRFNQNGYR